MGYPNICQKCYFLVLATAGFKDLGKTVRRVRCDACNRSHNPKLRGQCVQYQRRTFAMWSTMRPMKIGCSLQTTPMMIKYELNDASYLHYLRIVCRPYLIIHSISHSPPSSVECLCLCVYWTDRL